MAVAAEQAIFEIVVKGDQAKRELGAVRSSAETLGGGLDKLNKGLNKFDAATREAQKVVRGLGDAMGGTKSQAVEMIGVAADLGGAFASGGVFGVGMAAALYSVTQLTRAWNLDKEQAKQWGEFLKTQVKSDVDILLKSIRDLNTEAGQFGLDARGKQVSSLRTFVDDSERAAGFFKSDIEERQAIVAGQEKMLANFAAGRVKLGEATIDKIHKEIALQKVLIEGSKAKLAAEERDLAVGRDNLSLLEQQANKEAIFDQAEKRKKEAEEAAKKAQSAAEKSGGTVGLFGVRGGAIWDAMFLEGRKQEEAWRAADLAAEKQHKEDMLEQARQLAIESDQIADEGIQQASARSQIITEIEKEGIEERQRLLEQDMEFRTQIATEALGIGVSASQQLLDGFITGQDHALELFAVNVMRQAGSAMIGHGINALAGGIAANSLIPGSGTVAMGTGAGLIAGGIALGGAATGVEHTMVNGGQLFTKLPDPSSKSASDRGVNSGRGRGGPGGGDGAGITYTFNYGVAGPQPDETAREIARQNRRARSRGFADETITVSR